MRPIRFASLLAICVFAIGAGAAGPSYRVSELLPAAAHPGGSTTPKGITSAGETVGYSVSADDRDGRAVFWPAGSDVPTVLSSEKSFAFAVADDSLIAGGAINTPERNHAALFAGGATFFLPDPFPQPSDNPSTHVTAVINATTAAGEAQYPGVTHAILWRPAGATILPNLGYPNAGVTDANASGTVIGRAVVPGSFQFRGVVWENGALVRVLQPLPGQTQSMAEGINAAGDIAGTSFASAVVWPSGSAVPYALPLPPDGRFASGLGINDHGWVVGVVSDIRGRAGAVLWTDAQTAIHLNSLIPPGSGWQLDRAMYVNNDGVILGEGRFNGRFTAFRLEPIKATPIVVLPGILGTSLLEQTPAGDEEVWFSLGPYDALALDGSGQNTAPIVTGPVFEQGFLDIYRDLLQFLEANGYQRDVTLFTFPYDWRKHNGDHSQLLEAYIEQFVLPPSDSSEVIIVAHSMGGFLARQLALRRPDLVDKVIYVGTPHAGAAEAFTALAFDDDLGRNFSGVPADLATVAPTFPSVYQLLPRLPFIFSLDEQRVLPLAETYTPAFLRSVTWLPLADQFHTDIAAPPAVTQTQIAGSALPTLGSIVTFTAAGDRKWFPLIENGDGTVMRMSAGAAPGAPQPVFVGDVAHDALTADPCVQDVILRAIRDEAPPACSSSQPFPLPAGVSWSTGSPVRVTIHDPADRINEDIPRSRFWTLENNEGGFLATGVEYRFEIVAHETGVFSLTFRDQQETTIEFSGVPVAAGSRATLVLRADGTTSDMELDGITIGSGPAAPDVALSLLARVIERLAIGHGLRASLLAKVEAAARAVARDQRHTAANVLHAMLGEIDSQAGKGLTASDASGLRAAVISILDGL